MTHWHLVECLIDEIVEGTSVFLLERGNCKCYVPKSVSGFGTFI